MIFICYLLILFSIIYLRHVVHEGTYLNKRSQGFHWIRQEQGIPFIITKERWYHRALVWMRLSKELRTDNDAFDRRFFIMTDTPEHLSRICSDPEFQQALTTLFDFPVKTLYSSRTRLWFNTDKTRQYKTMKGGIELNDLNHKRLRALQELLQQIIKKDIRHTSPTKTSSRRRALIFLGLHAAFLGLALLGYLPTALDSAQIANISKIHAYAIIFGLGFCIIWFFAILVVMAGRPWFGWVMADFIALGIIGIIGSTGFFLREANIRLDASLPTVKTFHLSYKSCALRCVSHGYRRRSSHTYTLSDNECVNLQQTLDHYKRQDYKCRKSYNFEFYLYFPGIDGEERLKVPVDYETYVQDARGDRYAVPVHPGRFGIKWLRPATVTP